LNKIDRYGANRLRRCVLSYLYEWFRQYPLASIELRQLAEVCDVDAGDLNWNLSYLEKKGWINLDLSVDCPPFIACTAGITAEGIDLVEDDAVFQAQFTHHDGDAS
jgi:hypothetical protein